MKHILRVIENELRVLDKDEREEYRKAVLNSFSKITEGVYQKMETFETKVLEKVGKDLDIVDIHILLINKEDYILYEDKFYPMCKEINVNLKEALLSEDKIYKEIFIEASYDEIQTIKNEEIRGEVNISGERHVITFELVENQNYTKRIKDLYDVFSLNGLSWKTVLNPYAKKMFCLKIRDYDYDLLDKVTEKEIVEINFDKKFKEDLILCWNIEEKRYRGAGTIQPTKDRIHSEVTLTLSSNENVYICPSDKWNIYLVERNSDESITMITEDTKNMLWNVFEVREVEDNRLTKLDYKSFNNNIELNFLNKLRFTKNDLKIRTMAELGRIIESFSVVKEYLTFVTAVVERKKDYKDVGIYDCNFFIVDEFRIKENQDILRVKFKVKKHDNYTKDIISFIISEIQLYFVEYNCVGDINE